MVNRNLNWSLLIFIMTAIICAFFISDQFIDYYRFKLTGALFELFYLPSMMMIIFIVIFSITRLLKDKFTLKSLYIYSLLIIAFTFLYLIFLIDKR